MVSDSSILVDDQGGVRTITLNRPDVLNAFDQRMLEMLVKTVRDAAKDRSVRCLMLTGAGRAFCSGQDLAEVADKYKSDEPIELGNHLRKLYNPMIAKLRTMEKPVIGAINGVAAGAGCSLALACDVRIAAESASFVEAFIHVGLVPDCGSTFMLPRLVGLGRAMEIACSGRKVKSDEAERIGLVNRVVPDAALATEAAKMAAGWGALPAKGLGLTKRLMNMAWTSDLETQLDFEAQCQTTAGQTPDHREGVVAFLEKRKPKFDGA